MEQLRIDPSIAYDVVELPSKGIHYANKKKSLRVAYLTASDENILAAPSLVTTNSVVTELLKRKILDRDISVDEIVEEDKQAIIGAMSIPMSDLQRITDKQIANILKSEGYDVSHNSVYRHRQNHLRRSIFRCNAQIARG